MEQSIEPEISPKRSNRRFFSSKVSPMHCGISSVLIDNDIPTAATMRVMDRRGSSKHEYHHYCYDTYHCDQKHVVVPLSREYRFGAQPETRTLDP